MSYAKFGVNCIEKSIAFTSNTKFLSPVDQIYFQPLNTQKKVEKTDYKEDKLKQDKLKQDKFKKDKFKKDKRSSTCKSCGSS